MSTSGFTEIFEEISRKLYDETLSNTEMDDCKKYYKNMYNYNVYDGKQNRAKALVRTHQYLNKNSTKEEIKKSYVLGACIEILQASFLIHDDIMDNSATRRGKKCWYLKGKESGYGLISVNDGLHLNAIIHKILKLYFRKEPYYVELVDLFNDIINKTIYGQCLDMLTSSDTINWEKFTKSNYEEIVKWKTAFYSFYLPVASAMIMNNITDEKLFSKSEKILLKIGEYFQIQDDFLDCFGKADQIGKIGRDIEEGKCCWLIITAFERGSEAQIHTVKANYGQDDPEKVEIVKKIYEELDIQSIFREYEDNVYQEISVMIDDFGKSEESFPTRIFKDFLDQIYRRSK